MRDNLRDSIQNTFSFFASHKIKCRYSLIEEFTEPPIPQTTVPSTTTQSNGPASSIIAQIVSQTNQTSSTLNNPPNLIQSNTIPTNPFNASTTKPISRKGGIIFPSVKNKPSVGNSTFTTDILSLKDVKVSY